MNFETNFKRLNSRQKEYQCCKGECFINYISEVDTLVCGKCEKMKHIDHFLESDTGYLCDKCYKSNSLKENECRVKLKFTDKKVNICYSEDIQKAVLKFKEYLNGDCRNINYSGLTSKFRELFGDW